MPHLLEMSKLLFFIFLNPILYKNLMDPIVIIIFYAGNFNSTIEVSNFSLIFAFASNQIPSLSILIFLLPNLLRNFYFFSLSLSLLVFKTQSLSTPKLPTQFSRFNLSDPSKYFPFSNS